MGDDRLNSTAVKTDGATSASLFLALLLLASGAALNLSSAPSALEARSFFFAKTYFTSTLLLSIFNSSMPMYHLVSHFLLFINPSLLTMRLFSVAFGAISVLCLSKTISLIKNKTNSLTPVHAIFVAPAAGAIACFSGRAVEQSLGFCLIFASFLFLAKALLNNDSSKRSLFIAASIAAAYSFNIGAVIVVPQMLLLKKYVRATETISDKSVLAFRRDTSLILKCMIPALFIWLIGCVRAAAGATHAPGTFSYPSGGATELFKAALGWNHLLPPTVAFSILFLI
ncbi:MAG TPA: hypothetical protein PLQ76_09950, partial [bacterium]|nr:hypothetical protein [bacterium]